MRSDNIRRFAACSIMALALSGCLGDDSSSGFGFGRSNEPGEYVPPNPDAAGVITYQSYQVAVAGQGDSVRAMADRFGQSVDEMSALNGIHPDTTLRAGEVIVLPRGVGGSQIIDGRVIAGGAPIPRPGEVDIQTIALDAIEEADPQAAAPQTERPADEPLRHRVQRGESASTIAARYDVSVRALADWNGLGPDNAVRVGQSLLIPPPNAVVTPILRPAEQPLEVSEPGQGTRVPQPPSASNPLPENAPAASEPVAEAKPEPAPEPVETGGVLTLPAKGPIIRDFKKGSSDGIDIAAPSGSPVVAAGSGTVAAITQDSGGNSIIVIRHSDGLLTVYAGVDNITVERGQSVSRGQKIAVVRSGEGAFLHFETRRGFESVDPNEYL